MPQINAQRLGWLELTAALLAALLWYSFPQIGWWPVLIMGLPVGARLWARQTPFVRTPLDIFLLLFLVTAVSGLWAAYDRDAAFAKFWILLGGLFLYYALAAQPRANIWPVTAVLLLVGAGITTLFLLTHDWRALPADLDALNRIGLAIMRLRPELPLGGIVDNIAGGIIAGLLPLAVSWGWRGWRQRWWMALLGAALAGGLMLFGLALTSSRGSWLALAAALTVWLLWSVSGRIVRSGGYLRPALAGLVLVCGAAAVGAVTQLYFGGLVNLANALPGHISGSSRYELAQNSWQLARDFFWTGGGLAAFAGLYSQYIQVIPYFLFSYSHNFYLDLLLEQGIFGLLALLAVIAGTAGLLWQSSLQQQSASVPENGYLRWGIFTGLLAICLHGFVDSALYAGQGTPFLFVWAGLAAAVYGTSSRQPAQLNEHFKRIRWWGLTAVVAAVCLIAFFLRQPLAASWHANLGAVAMAQVELADFPANEWVGDRHLVGLGPAVAQFHRALAHDPDNSTAHYRLGLIALAAEEFEAAVAHLEKAQAVQPDHRGIVKALGYSYAWSGHIGPAQSLLHGLPETRNELDAYIWWWDVQGRPDLATYARQLNRYLR
jgi:putative inorganic carbon (hco3(-)) transporter